jgi:L-threonylcarbamoyladenylate synthase
VQHRTSQWVQLAETSFDAYLQSHELQQAASFLRAGKLVAFPTETVYGLGADATSQTAVQQIFAAKGRPEDNPLIAHFADATAVYDWVDGVSSLAERLMAAFWPGPLTLVMRHRGNFASAVTAGLPTVAVRVPAHPVAHALLRLAEVPIAAPSANRSGRPSPTTAAHVWHDFAERIAMLLDAGPAAVGLESTVLDVSDGTPLLLRPGGVPLEEIERLIGTVQIDPGLQQEVVQPRSPGMKYRHYAPDGEMWLFRGELAQVTAQIRQRIAEARESGRTVGVLTTTEQQAQYDADLVVACGSRAEPDSVAQQLYAALHQFNAAGIELILAETFPERGVFYSVMNRLKKAAGGKVIEV